MHFNRATRSHMVATIVMFALGLVFGAIRLSAQSQAFTATISGTVTDRSGSLVSGAKVTLTSVERGITRSFVTRESGTYTITLLPPADYNLKVEQPGFQTYEQRGISLAAGASATQDIVISVGAVTQEVVVSDSAPLLNTDNANISADISQKQVVELPSEPPQRLRSRFPELLGQQLDPGPDGQLQRNLGKRRSGYLLP